MTVDLDAVRKEINEAIKLIAEKHNLVVTQWDYVGVRLPGGRTTIRPESTKNGDEYLLIDNNIKRW